MKLHDMIVGLIFLAIGVFVTAYSQTLVAPRNASFGPGFFPLLLGSALCLVGIGIAVTGFKARHGATLASLPDWIISRSMAIRFWALPAAILIYVAVVDFLGFLATATVLLAALMIINGAGKRNAVVVAVLVALAMNIGFASLLHVPLPWGPLTPISGWFIW